MLSVKIGENSEDETSYSPATAAIKAAIPTKTIPPAITYKNARMERPCSPSGVAPGWVALRYPVTQGLAAAAEHYIQQPCRRSGQVDGAGREDRRVAPVGRQERRQRRSSASKSQRGRPRRVSSIPSTLVGSGTLNCSSAAAITVACAVGQDTPNDEAASATLRHASPTAQPIARRRSPVVRHPAGTSSMTSVNVNRAHVGSRRLRVVVCLTLLLPGVSGCSSTVCGGGRWWGCGSRRPQPGNLRR